MAMSCLWFVRENVKTPGTPYTCIQHSTSVCTLNEEQINQSQRSALK